MYFLASKEFCADNNWFFGKSDSALKELLI